MTPAFVFHTTDPPSWPITFTLVATVEACSDPDMAYRLTQHAWTDWRDNPGVQGHIPAPRSTKTGDVVRLNGQAWRCDLLGWTALHG